MVADVCIHLRKLLHRSADRQVGPPLLWARLSAHVPRESRWGATRDRGQDVHGLLAEDRLVWKTLEQYLGQLRVAVSFHEREGRTLRGYLQSQ